MACLKIYWMVRLVTSVSPLPDLNSTTYICSADFLSGHRNHFDIETTINSDPLMSVDYAVVHLSIMIIWGISVYASIQLIDHQPHPKRLPVFQSAFQCIYSGCEVHDMPDLISQAVLSTKTGTLQMAYYPKRQLIARPTFGTDTTVHMPSSCMENNHVITNIL